MKPISQHRNAIVRWTVIVILVADLVLLGVDWRLNRSPHVQSGDLRRLDMLEKSYRADNARLERFRRELPADKKDWDEFFTTHFHPAGAGYSAISEDLGELSRTAGLRSDAITFHQHDADTRGLVEI